MTTDLWMLVWTGLLCSLLPIIYGTPRMQAPGGAAWGLGNRDEPFPAPLPAWSERAVRAHLNLLENLTVFAILVLVAHVAGKANAMTAAGATLFFWARVAHALVYMMGIVYLRTIVFFLGSIGQIMILIQLFR